MDFEKAKQFPSIVNINVMSGRCPCSCVHCPMGSVAPPERFGRFGLREMDLALFFRIVEEISQNNSLIRIHSVGEPLLWRNLPDSLPVLRNFGVKSWLFTSAVTDNKELLVELCENISIIEVSVNATKADEYCKTKGIDAFGMVSENIAFMSQHVRKNGLNTRLLLSRVQTNDETSDNKFIAYWKDKQLADDVFVRSYHNYNNILDIRGEADVKKPCLVHWARASIDCDGTVVCCFNELFKKYSDDVILGRLDEQTSIKQIWKGDKLALIRSCDMSGDFSRLPFKIPCESCRTCQPLDTVRETSEKQLNAIT